MHVQILYCYGECSYGRRCHIIIYPSLWNWTNGPPQKGNTRRNMPSSKARTPETLRKRDREKTTYSKPTRSIRCDDGYIFISILHVSYTRHGHGTGNVRAHHTHAHSHRTHICMHCTHNNAPRWDILLCCSFLLLRIHSFFFGCVGHNINGHCVCALRCMCVLINIYLSGSPLSVVLVRYIWMCERDAFMAYSGGSAYSNIVCNTIQVISFALVGLLDGMLDISSSGAMALPRRDDAMHARARGTPGNSNTRRRIVEACVTFEDKMNLYSIQSMNIVYPHRHCSIGDGGMVTRAKLINIQHIYLCIYIYIYMRYSCKSMNWCCLGTVVAVRIYHFLNTYCLRCPPRLLVFMPCLTSYRQCCVSCLSESCHGHACTDADSFSHPSVNRYISVENNNVPAHGATFGVCAMCNGRTKLSS